MHYPGNSLVEICVDSFEMAMAAQKAGANRIELCVSLVEGGITPPLALVQKVCGTLDIPVNVMIRPRGGDFLYSDVDFELMQSDIRHFFKAGAAGFVFGILKDDGSIDEERCKILMDSTKSKNVTFHRAFDMTCDPFLALEEIIELGINTILTSGQRQTAEDGFELIQEVVKRTSKRITIMAGSGVNSHNVKLLHEAGVREFHFTARKKIDGVMKYRNNELQSIGASTLYSEYDTWTFDENKIRDVLAALDSL